MAQETVIAMIHQENGVYGISFPDFPGCVSGGESPAELDQAVAKAEQVLAFHIAGMIEDDEELPRIRKFSELAGEFEPGALLALVHVDLPGKAVRLNISMEESLVKAIDRASGGPGRRSAWLADAARERLRKAS